MSKPRFYNPRLEFHKRMKNRNLKHHEVIQHYMKLTPYQWNVYRQIAKSQAGHTPSFMYANQNLDVSQWPSHKNAVHVAKMNSGAELSHKMMDSEPGSGWFDWAKKAVSFVTRNIPKIKKWFKTGWSFASKYGGKAMDIVEKVEKVTKTVRDVTDVGLREIENLEILEPETIKTIERYRHKLVEICMV